MINDGSTSDSNDGDYNDRNGATSSQTGFRLQKGVRRTKNAGDCNTIAHSTHYLDVSY
jgi:hypothetical protein